VTEERGNEGLGAGSTVKVESFEKIPGQMEVLFFVVSTFGAIVVSYTFH